MGGGGDDVAVGERVVGLPRRDQPRDVCHVRHEVGADFIRNLQQYQTGAEETTPHLGYSLLTLVVSTTDEKSVSL